MNERGYLVSQKMCAGGGIQTLFIAVGGLVVWAQ